MKRSPVDIAYDHVSGMRRNYPDWPSTFGCCSEPECNKSARGCGVCADCHENKLAEIVGISYAHKVHESIKASCRVWGDLKDHIKKTLD